MATNNDTTNAATDDIDPLAAALNEAQQLMDELGGAGRGDDVVDLAGFSIDSDEEDDGEDGDPLTKMTKTTMKTGAAAAATATASPATATDEAAVEAAAAHPLSDVFLSAPPQQQTHQQTQPTGGLMHPLVNHPAGAPAAATTSPQQQQPLHSTTPHLQSSPIHAAYSETSSSSSSFHPLASVAEAASSAAAPSLDVLKQQTSRFASNLANMAQRAASQVATTVGTPTSSAAAAAGSVISSPSMMMFQTPQQLQYQQQQQQQQSTALVSVELDNEQKAALISTHVGELLPGERVIMFLANLLHVSDSTGFSYNASNNNNNSNDNSGTGGTGVWCCAMTYYRLLLFGTHPVSPPPRPNDWNATCWPSDAVHLLQMPLASMDRVEKSVFTVATSSANYSNAGGMSNNIATNGSSNMTTTMTLMGLVITGKDNGRTLRFTTPSYADTIRALEALQNYAFPGRRNLGYLFAFESKKEDVMNSIVVDAVTGQKKVTLAADVRRFDAVAEFTRQLYGNGNTSNNQGIQPWTIYTQMNAPQYQLCHSYPSIIAGPASLDETKPEHARILQQSAAFRSEGRMPALTWAKSSGGGSLWRASQPRVGLQGNRSFADEMLLKHIREQAAAANALSASASPDGNGGPRAISRQMIVQLTGSPDVQNWLPSNYGSSNGSGTGNAATVAAGVGNELKILDLRPRSSALGNRTGGYGYENTSHYTGTTLQFCNIGNIHAVRDAYQKISNLCSNPNTQDVQWNALVEDTKWLSQIRLVLAASWEAAFWIHVHHLPVLLHCSHGWDRTSQVAVLCQLLLDPYYRTRQGFACLVEKDFMSFGHPFHLRCAHGERRAGSENEMLSPSATVSSVSMLNASSDDSQRSPIFIQFLDCVYQIIHQYPECFEFNTKYLLLMSEHVYSCRFGNFLCDTERERELLAGLRQRTHSIWDFLEERTDTVNPSFRHERNHGVLLMPLPTLLRNVTLWHDRHARYGPKATARWMPPDIKEIASCASLYNNSNSSSNHVGTAIGLSSGGGGLDNDDDHGGSHARTTIQQNQHLLALLASSVSSSSLLDIDLNGGGGAGGDSSSSIVDNTSQIDGDNNNINNTATAANAADVAINKQESPINIPALQENGVSNHSSQQQQHQSSPTTEG